MGEYFFSTARNRAGEAEFQAIDCAPLRGGRPLAAVAARQAICGARRAMECGARLAGTHRAGSTNVLQVTDRANIERFSSPQTKGPPVIALVTLAVLSATPAAAGPATEPVGVILVHGAFADGSGWSKVIQKLDAKGVRAMAVQLPETSLQDDVAATKRMIAAMKGPVVLVGHSYGGVVITAAADGEATVKALVYVAALVPDQGESGGELFGKYPAPGAPHVVPQSGDFLWIDPPAFHESFCQDISAADAKLMAATQKPINKAAFGEKLTKVAAWHTLPSWFVLTTADRMVTPELQRFEAKRMESTVVEVAASHVPFLSKPDAVVKAIIAATTAAPKK